jgi:hypothetical protein
VCGNTFEPLLRTFHPLLMEYWKVQLERCAHSQRTLP